jgi:riboflavin synthase
MFTGIVSDLAEIHNLAQSKDEDLLISLKISDRKNLARKLEIGCSISCSGACLTLVKKESLGNMFILDFQASKETISKTNIKNWQIGKQINIEFALKIGDELGGHLVSGHVDGLAKVSDIEKSDQSHIFTFEIDNEFRKFICQKGSVTLDGVSLTVNDTSINSFKVNIIDHTFNNTDFCKIRVGEEVNLEIDQIARYLDNLNKYK